MRMTMKMMIAVVLGLGLAGCAMGSTDCADTRIGACKVKFARLMTDTSLTVDGLGGAGMSYSSSPNAQAMTDSMKALSEALALAMTRGSPQSANFPPPGSEFEGSRGVSPMPRMQPVPPLCPAMAPVARVTPPSVYIERVVETKGGPLALYEGI